MKLDVLKKEHAVCRLQSMPLLEGESEFMSLTVSGDEISLVCETEHAPDDGVSEKGWRGLRVCGVLDFSLVGILAGLTKALANAGIPVFVVSTYDTDYLFVKQDNFAAAIKALKAAGCEIEC